jgi:pimeloyl-ACP methyl ester carboxylesterase
VVRPLEIAVPDAVLDDLRARLGRTRWPDAVVEGWEDGADVAYLRELCATWRDGFDWRARERALNALEHVRVEVDGVGLHAVLAGAGQPLVLLHGWPSSFLQMVPILPLLEDAFALVVPSLPGYGFSDRPTRPGVGPARTAELVAGLMDALGHNRFAVRASDLGAGVAMQLALAHPERVRALHLSGTNPFVPEVPDDLTEAEERFLADTERWRRTEMAYAMQHATKPQTLAVGLHDSPAGLAAWVVEKLRAWSDCDGDVERAFSREALLDNLTVYWATGTAPSSVRLYREATRDPATRWGRVEVPTAMAMAPADMYPTPREWAERSWNVVRWTELERGGHFAEWEVPELVAEDLRAFLLG